MLLERQLDTWLEPLRQLDPAGDPAEEIGAYIRRKLEMARDYPRESRLFAGEILQGAPVSPTSSPARSRTWSMRKRASSPHGPKPGASPR